MLNLLRKNTKVIAWVMVGAFILWGAFSFGISFDKREQYAGEVFGRDVSFQEFNLFLRGSEIFSFTGEVQDDPKLIRIAAWQNIIYADEARRQGYEVSDEEVRKELRRLLTSYGIGDADAETYKRWLATAVRMEAADFEKLLRETMRIQKLLKKVSQTPVEPPAEEEVRRLYIFENSRINAEAVVAGSMEEAEKISKEAVNEEAWKKMTSESKHEVIPLENIPLVGPLRLFGLEAEDALLLNEAPVGKAFQPIALKDEKAVVFFIFGKEPADMNVFEEKRDEFAKTAMERRKNAYFSAWHMDLMQRANLKDYSGELDRPANELPAATVSSSEEETPSAESAPSAAAA